MISSLTRSSVLIAEGCKTRVGFSLPRNVVHRNYYCSDKSPGHRPSPLSEGIKKISEITSKSAAATKHTVANITEGATERSKHAVEVAKNTILGTKEVIEDVNKVILESKNAVVDTASSVKRMLKICSAVIIACGSLFAIGIAAESTAKIFESYGRIKKVIQDTNS